MEARANYVAVGAFVLVVLVGILVGSLWLARVQFSTQYQYIETNPATWGKDRFYLPDPG